MPIHSTDKEEFTKLVYQGYTIPQLMERYNCSRGSIATAKRNWGLVGKTPNSQRINAIDGTKHCFSCNITKPLSEFYSNGKTINGSQKFKPTCKVCEKENRRENLVNHIFTLLKELNIAYSCKDCNLSGEYGLLDFHHKDPTLKLFEIGHTSNSTSTYEAFKAKNLAEVLKCDILCPTCHRRRHMLWG